MNRLQIFVLISVSLTFAAFGASAQERKSIKPQSKENRHDRIGVGVLFF